MEGKFIYVFSEEDRDEFLRRDFHLFKSVEDKHEYIFLNKNRLEFSGQDGLPDVTYVVTDVLTF